MQIGDKIKARRLQKGINQTELARLLGMDQKTISNWEINKYAPNTQNLAKISEVLDIPMEELTDNPYLVGKKEDNKIMKLIDALHDAGAITADYIDDSTRDVIINTIQKYIKEKESRED